MNHPEAQVDALCEQAAQRGEDHKTLLAQAMQTEWQGRYRRGTEARCPRPSRQPPSSPRSVFHACGESAII